MINTIAKPQAAVMNSFIGKDILDIASLSRDQLEAVIYTAASYAQKLADKERLYDMDGKIMAALFLEPSTRTRMSFESAMLRLGGQVITVAGSNTTSIAKGERLQDSISIVSAYCDVIVCRTAQSGARIEAAAAAHVPFINAGDGVGQHPTQAITDIYTIMQEKGTLDGLTVALVGDLKHGRTVHSLVDALALYDVKMIFASTADLKMPQDITAGLKAKGMDIDEVEDFSYALAQADVLYMTRIQKERFAAAEPGSLLHDDFIFTAKRLADLRDEAIIMHPLPRLQEIEKAVDDYAGAAYFRQAANGVPVRMALLAMVLGQVQ